MLATSNFLVPNATFVVELVAFLLTLAVLAKYVLPVINKTMDERQATLRQALTDAEEAKRRAAESEEEYKRVVNEARSQARGIIDEANKMGEQTIADRRQRAESEAEQIIGRARQEIDLQARRASEDLRQQAADLAITVAEKVLGEGIDASAHRQLIDRTIAEVESRSGSEGVTV
ncbi:MAG TPA: F0F1 ATP synthase subunit B [Acidimicrobiales bacterium]|nr:F0F1 ATP synthase subunit B [Acidimicrobiales bacterium]